MSLQPLSSHPAIFKYLTVERALSPEQLADANIQVEVDASGASWIAFPLQHGTKLRAAPGNPSPAKGKYLEEGTKAELYYAGILCEGMKAVMICEGEIDCLTLNQLGFNAVCGTSGAGTFYETWLSLLPKDCDVTLVYDNDEAGHQGRSKVRGLIQEYRRDIRLFDVFFAPDAPKGYDVNDWYREQKNYYPGATDTEIAALFTELIKAWRAASEGGRDYRRPVAEVARPVEDVSFSEWLDFVDSQFPQLTAASEVCASVVSQLLIQGITNCFGLILVDVPSSGKTIALNFFAGIEEIVYTSDDFSPAALVSHAAQKKSKELGKIDMLPKIRWKTLLVREMATVFGDRDDDLRKKLHLLTRVMDGEGLETESGIHGKRGYQGDYLFMLLGASTPIPLRIWKVMGGAGHRLFFLSLDSKRIGVDELHSILKVGSHKAREVAVREKTHDFLRTLWSRFPSGVTWDASRDDHETMMWISRLSHFIAHFRGEILVYSAWGDGENGAPGAKELQHTRPQIEQPTRLAALLYGLTRGRAVLEGRNYVVPADLGPAIRLMLDTAPDPRPLVLRELMTIDPEQGVGVPRHVDAKSVADSMKCAVNTAKKEMEKLIVLGVAKNVIGFENVTNPDLGLDEAVEDVAPGGRGNKKQICLADEYTWLVSEEFRDMCTELKVDLSV